MKESIVALVSDQCEYWKREFSAFVIKKDKFFFNKVDNLVKKGIVPIVQIDNNLDELELISSLPKKSIIGWCAADELLDFEFAKSIANIGSFITLLRPYHLNHTSPRNLLNSAKYLINNLVQIKSVKELISIFNWFIRGVKMSLQEERIIRLFKNNKQDFYNFPLGYTDVFCKSYLKVLNVNVSKKNTSLLDNEMYLALNPDIQFGFIGQTGQILRKVAIRAAEKAPRSIIVKRAEYGAGDYKNLLTKKQGIEYVKLLHRSKFIICPPGNISGDTFRIYESIVMRRIPLVMSNVTSDPNFNATIKAIPGGGGVQSWRKLLAIAAQLSKKQYENLVQENLSIFNNEIYNAKKFILLLQKNTN